ncbi:hypothetical protein COLO4_28000 [Corchorus olitorius]|uniref:F-box associated beta-propeller type 1 domain-containing protein n=1 Tax=Corchorus olitorius TaxID=93759 RepID=A0A1R3HNE5_9ROSI|nr:hypothetical protein COLO4_28000 [Corchorus olitorius]
MGDILLRVSSSIKTLIPFRSVCKSWYQVLSDPYFTRNLSLLISNDYSGKTYLVQVEKDLISSPTSYSMKDDIDCSSGCPIGSCHGLLCFERNNSETYIVNPVLGSDDDLVIMLPSMNTETEVPSLFPVRIFNLMGFGFCPNTNQYKVVRTIRSTLRVYIYTLGTDDSWREIEDLPTDRFTSCLPGVYLNGALHWLTYPRIESDDRKLEIYCFDVETEKSHQLDLLPQLLQGRNNLDGLKLGVLDNCLALYIKLGGCFSNFDIWVMKDEKCWANIFRISGVAPLSVWNRDRVEPLMLTEDGNSLIAYAEEDDERRLLKHFDVRTGKNITNRTLIEKGTITSGRRYTAHVATLMSPKHIMKRSTCHV